MMAARDDFGANAPDAPDGLGENPGDAHDILREQIAYYRARASEYDEWFLRQGRYDRGPEENARWHTEAGQVAGALDRFLDGLPRGACALELAGGTGLWTERLAQRVARLTVVDAAPEALALNRDRLSGRLGGRLDAGAERAERVEYVTSDLFDWRPARRYDAVFFGFWLSHVPPERFAAFWALVRDALTPRGRVFVVDSLYEPRSTARDHRLDGPGATTVRRSLNDGRAYRIVKVFYTPERLTDALAPLGWRSTLAATPTYFLYGEAAPTTTAADPPSG